MLTRNGTRPGSIFGMDENTDVTPDPVGLPGGLRASDAEREDTAEVLRAAASEGRITLAELEDRVAACYAARLREELAPLVADLPPMPSEASEPERHAAGRLTTGGRVALTVHAVLVVVFASAVLGRWMATGAVFFWPVFPIFWAMVTLAVHARIRGALPLRTG